MEIKYHAFGEQEIFVAEFFPKIRIRFKSASLSNQETISTLLKNNRAGIYQRFISGVFNAGIAGTKNTGVPNLNS